MLLESFSIDDVCPVELRTNAMEDLGVYPSIILVLRVSSMPEPNVPRRSRCPSSYQRLIMSLEFEQRKSEATFSSHLMNINQFSIERRADKTFIKCVKA